MFNKLFQLFDNTIAHSTQEVQSQSIYIITSVIKIKTLVANHQEIKNRDVSTIKTSNLNIPTIKPFIDFYFVSFRL